MDAPPFYLRETLGLYSKKRAKRATRSDLKILYTLEELLPGDDV